MAETKSKQFLRKQQVAKRYNIHERSVDRMSREGRLPAPIYRGNRFPLWDEDELDESDRRFAMAGREAVVA